MLKDEDCKQLVQDAVYDLRVSIQNALAEFTQQTGLCVSDVVFDSAEVKNDKGETKNVAYYNIKIRTVV